MCIAVGSNVTNFVVGDHIGVGCMVDSCGTCGACKAGDEHKCAANVMTYNGKVVELIAIPLLVSTSTLFGLTCVLIRFCFSR